MSSIWLASYLFLWLLVLALAVAVILLYRQLGEMYLGTSESRSRDGIRVGTRAPSTTLSDQRGVARTFPSPRPTLVVFGAPTCGPCVDLMPDLVAFAEQRPTTDFWFVSTADSAANNNFARQHRLQFPVLTDSDQRVALQYKVRVTPFAFYIDAAGVVRAKSVVNRLSQLRALVQRADAPLSPAVGRDAEKLLLEVDRD